MIDIIKTKIFRIDLVFIAQYTKLSQNINFIFRKIAKKVKRVVSE